MTQDEAVRRIKKALQRRSGKTWRVTTKGPIGSVTIAVSRTRQVTTYGAMSPSDCELLQRLLGLADRVHVLGVFIPAKDRDEYVARAEDNSLALHT